MAQIVDFCCFFQMYIIFILISQASAWGKFDTLYDALKVRIILFNQEKYDRNVICNILSIG